VAAAAGSHAVHHVWQAARQQLVRAVPLPVAM
jgi:hypothetical protein